MALIKCEGCGAVHEAAGAACPACGRCPGCGAQRIPGDELPKECDQCKVAFCSSCGRCPACGKLRPVEVEPCGCGHPNDAEKLAQVEKTFGLQREPSPPSVGCGIALLLLAIGLLALIYWLS